MTEAACGAYRALGLRGYGRIDLRLAEDGRMVVIDVNPNPDLAPDLELTRAAAQTGIAYTSLIGWLVDHALGTSAAPPVARRD